MKDPECPFPIKCPAANFDAFVKSHFYSLREYFGDAGITCLKI